jgi:AcrR family transcriptional regulator
MTNLDRGDAPGLRERKKRQMRVLLSDVALRLAVERGIAHVRVEDIAAEAGISPRTFNNYFPSKEAAIVSVAALRADTLCAALSARPPHESLHDALTAAVLDLFADEPDRDWIARSQLIRDEPSLLAEERKSDALIELTIATEIAHRTNTDPSDLKPRLAASLTISAIHTAVRFWLDSAGSGSLHDTLTATMQHFRVLDTSPAVNPEC